MTQPGANGSRRRGRPPEKEAGRSEERVLDAATALFLRLGFGRTTLDKVSAEAEVGKSSLYARFHDKRGLFQAVVRRSIETMFADMPHSTPGETPERRLREVVASYADGLLMPRCVALMRMTAAEAEHMPELADMAYRVNLTESLDRVLAALEDSALPCDLDRRSTAERFIEVALQPLALQAIFGINSERLRQRVSGDVDDAILLLKAKGVKL